MSEPLDISTVLWADAQLGDWHLRHHQRTCERLIAFPRRSQVRQLLPWRASTVVATAHRQSDDRPSHRWWRDSLGVALLLTGGAVTRSRRLGVQSQESLVTSVASQLGHEKAYGIVLCGPPRANQKPVVQLHDRRGRTIAFVKVAWNALTRQLLDDEHAALVHLDAIIDRGFSSPRVVATGTFGDAAWLALEPVAVERRTRSDRKEVDALAVAIEHTGPSWEGPTAEAGYIAQLTQAAAGLTEGQRAVETLIERRSAQTMRLGASHGDFVPWNMLSGSPQPAVWDWERYRTSVPIGFDRLHLRTQVGLHRDSTPFPETLRRLGSELGDLLPDVPPEMRDAHLDWYLADLLCRYERDMDAHPTLLPTIVTDLAGVLKDRHTST